MQVKHDVPTFVLKVKQTGDAAAATQVVDAAVVPLAGTVTK